MKQVPQSPIRVSTLLVGDARIGKTSLGRKLAMRAKPRTWDRVYLGPYEIQIMDVDISEVPLLPELKLQSRRGTVSRTWTNLQEEPDSQANGGITTTISEKKSTMIKLDISSIQYRPPDDVDYAVGTILMDISVIGLCYIVSERETLENAVYKVRCYLLEPTKDFPNYVQSNTTPHLAFKIVCLLIRY